MWPYQYVVPPQLNTRVLSFRAMNVLLLPYHEGVLKRRVIESKYTWMVLAQAPEMEITWLPLEKDICGK